MIRKRSCIKAGLAVAGCLQVACATTNKAPQTETLVEVPEGIPPQIFLEPSAREMLPAGVEARHVYEKGVNMTASFEGYRKNLYNDAAGYCTIGFGHLIKLAKCDGTESAEFKKGLEKPAAVHLLSQDMNKAEVPTQLMIKVDITDGQFAALCDFAFNCGANRLKKSSIITYINEGQPEKVAAQLRRYVKAGGKELPGLVKRREKEIELFYEGMPVPREAPSPDEDLSPIDILEPIAE